MTAPTREDQFLQELAVEYAKQGFRAMVSPSDALLPDFLQGTKIDLLLSSPTQNVVVQVKSRSKLRADQELPRLAAVLDGRPNWRLELMMFPEAEGEPSTSRPTLSVARARAQLREARVLVDSGHLVAALLVGWAAAEAMFRARIDASGSNRFVSPQALVTHLFSRGDLSEDDYHRLRGIADARNAAAHGFHGSDPDPSALLDFLTLVESIAALR